MIGAGGMGEVYKCHEIQTGAMVAIKMLLPEMAENEAALALFRREAAALHHLPHDSIVRYFVFTVEPTLQRPYLAMEFVDGRSLSDILAEGPLTFEALVKLMRRIASGLQAAHERGIIHRDVSPDNIIIIVPLGDVTRAKIIDFGIARSTQMGDKTIIGSGFAGKDNYVSPETGRPLRRRGYGQIRHLQSRPAAVLCLDRAEARHGRQPVSIGREAPARARSRRCRHADPPVARTNAAARSGKPPRDDGRNRRLADGIGSPARLRSAAARRTLGVPDRPAYGAETESPAALADPRCPLFWSRWSERGVYAFYTLVWSVPGTVRPPPLPEFGQKSEVAPPQASPPLPALRPAPPASAAGDAAARTDRVRRYVEQYNGGDCFFILPVAISPSAAVIEGFAASTAPFDALDTAFKRDLGFEASIGARLVTQAQCPAVKFLSQFGSNQARAPRINLDTVEVRNGETLSGSIENFANRVVELLLVSDSGEVRSLSYLLKPGTDSLSFSIGMQRSSGGDGPQLVMAVATPQVLDSLRQPKPTAADTFFLQPSARRSATTCRLQRSRAISASRTDIDGDQKRPRIRIFRSPSGLKSLAVNSRVFGAVAASLPGQKLTSRSAAPGSMVSLKERMGPAQFAPVLST